MRQINDAGLKLISQWEGLYLTAYHGAADRPGLLTIGYGHTAAAGPPVVKAGMKVTKKQAEDILRNDLSKVEQHVQDMVKVDLNDNQFATIVSFVFNCGEANFAKSSLLKKLNKGDYASVPTELMKWTKANGVQVQGLANRRAAEAGLWAKGAFVASQYVEPEPAKVETSTTGADAARAVGGTVAVGTAASQVVSAITGPVADHVEQVKQVVDTGGEVIDVTKKVVTVAPEGFWQSTLAFVQSPKFLAVALIIVIAAWGVTFYLRKRKEKEMAV